MHVSVHTCVSIPFSCAQRKLDRLLGLLALQFRWHQSVDLVEGALDLNLVCDLFTEVLVLVRAGVETLHTLVFRFSLQWLCISC